MTAQCVIRVLLADDQTMIRQGLGYIIKMQKDMQLVGEAANGDDAVRRTLETKPDVVLMDVQMPGLSGIKATREILKDMPEVKVVILTTFEVQDYVYEGIRSGAVGYLLKDADTDVMLETIRAAYRGEAVYRTGLAAGALVRALSPEVKASQNQIELLEPLTEREKEVLQQMAFGLKNDQIAETLFITEGTVKTHIHRLLQKFGAEDRTQLVVKALRGGLVK
ncbi:response regulator transcription factor [Desulfosporosinus sp. FKA]|uniref:response regulator transcription factor n=1 Tax=Desulfosporosinus sp. FKA TaxID=1969834 RepID=UPI000B498564|nr:response regulator transcription factor [Desulfosporosinus sp. FKA]